MTNDMMACVFLKVGEQHKCSIQHGKPVDCRGLHRTRCEVPGLRDFANAQRQAEYRSERHRTPGIGYR